MNAKIYRAVAILCFGVTVRGATLVVPASEDTSIFEIFPAFNLGGANLGAGSISQLATETQEPARTRSLMRFDVSGVPSGATITAVEVVVTVVKIPPAAGTGSTFELRRALRAWGEGSKGGLAGAQAVAGEATWVAAKLGETDWAEAGASGESDASATISSSVDIDGLGAYKFPTSSGLVGDVQSWIANPASNFGWLMKSNSEEIRQTARRFASKESATGKPTLTITYEIAVAELRINQFERREAGMFLSWVGGAAPFRVERAENVLGPWTAVTTASDATEAVATAGPEIAFYRVVSGAP